MPLDAPEALGGAEQTEAGPAATHVALAPALDIAGDVPKGRDEFSMQFVVAKKRRRVDGSPSLSTVSVSSSPSRTLAAASA